MGNMSPSYRALPLVITLCLIGFASIAFGQTTKSIESRVQAFLSVPDATARKIALDAIVDDPDAKDLLQPGNLSALLHRAVKFDKVQTGISTIDVRLEDGSV